MDRRSKEFLLGLLYCCWIYGVSGSIVKKAAAAPKVVRGLTQNLKTLPFEEGYMTLFGENNVNVSPDGKSVKLLLDRHTGSGVTSQDLYKYGFFSASIKLPEDYTAGIVTAFYTSNADNFEHNHDELDFEFLGNIRGKEWRVQTNLYGNGSTSFGREERYQLWFDPTEDFHQYSILWTEEHIIFFVDDIPIREVIKSESMGAQYPSKPMSVYATIWDGSEWATAGGRYKVNYKYGPFAMELTNLCLHGCAVDPTMIEHGSSDAHSHCGEEDEKVPREVGQLSEEEKAAMEWFRSRYIYYSYCDDRARYPSQLDECPGRDPAKPIATAHMRFGRHHHRHHRKRGKQNPHAASSSATADVSA
uniref:Xyloglucan endotransglucosylase/hydrolase n=1 Tax=Araucaria cunninghamii TaxID=56994 RepID=A0A0D6QYJ5_ARACU